MLVSPLIKCIRLTYKRINCSSILDRNEDSANILVRASDRSNWFTTMFVKYFVTGGTTSIVGISCLSLIYSYIRFGNLEVEHLFKPIKIV